MCTASWLHTSHGYHLLFNRDEKRSRLPAKPPYLRREHGVTFLAPEDGNFGGTWIAVNEYGVAACLLNGANLTSREYPSVGGNSRGLILTESIVESTAIGLCERIARLPLAEWQPFTVVALEPRRPAALIQWNGREALVPGDGESAMPLTSSSFDTAAARAARTAEFSRMTAARMRIDVDTLSTFHSSHQPSRSAYSPCMHRSDAQTVSFSRIDVTSSRITFEYYPSAPCRRNEYAVSEIIRLGYLPHSSI